MTKDAPNEGDVPSKSFEPLNTTSTRCSSFFHYYFFAFAWPPFDTSDLAARRVSSPGGLPGESSVHRPALLCLLGAQRRTWPGLRSTPPTSLLAAFQRLALPSSERCSPAHLCLLKAQRRTWPGLRSTPPTSLLAAFLRLAASETLFYTFFFHSCTV